MKNIAHTCAGQNARYKTFVNFENMEKVFVPTEILNLQPLLTSLAHTDFVDFDREDCQAFSIPFLGTHELPLLNCLCC